MDGSSSKRIREGFLLDGPETQIALDVWAAAAEGPNGELEVAVYVSLARRLRGDVETSDGWAPPAHYIERH